MTASLDLAMHTPTLKEPSTIKEYVLADFRTAAIFEKYNLDFCCGGGKTLEEACRKHGIDYAAIKRELEGLALHELRGAQPTHFQDWSISFLTDYIVHNHHKYVRRVTPVILMHADKVARVHGERHPNMIATAQLFAELAAELDCHMYKEETVLFPRLKLIESSLTVQEGVGCRVSSHQLSGPIKQMMMEHDVAGDLASRIRALTNNYSLPEGGCNTFSTLLLELQAFEQDLHQHVFIENNILFPRALLMEEPASLVSA